MHQSMVCYVAVMLQTLGTDLQFPIYMDIAEPVYAQFESVRIVSMQVLVSASLHLNTLLRIVRLQLQAL
jgi:hypothetical protein